MINIYYVGRYIRDQGQICFDLGTIAYLTETYRFTLLIVGVMFLENSKLLSRLEIINLTTLFASYGFHPPAPFAPPPPPFMTKPRILSPQIKRVTYTEF
jgi:hypothetical protein